MPEVNNKINECKPLAPARPAGFAGAKARVPTVILALLWGGGLGCCMAWINHYVATPGLAGRAPEHWPASSQIPRDPHLPTLVLFAHPQCPCTTATMGELELLMARARGELHAQVWFLKPENTPNEWTNTSLWHTAATIPGVSVHEDRDGREARRFQAGTSGQVLLYAANGRLLFQGGITESRGHSGDNAGRSAITALVLGEPAAVLQTPVFGCPLFDTNCPTGEVASHP
jgi:hypothetical protein